MRNVIPNRRGAPDIAENFSSTRIVKLSPAATPLMHAEQSSGRRHLREKTLSFKVEMTG
jgi:hypothetical protein